MLKNAPILLAILGSQVEASPALPPDQVKPRDALITASPVEYSPSKSYHDRRDLLKSAENYGNSILSNLGSDLPSWVASGIPQYFQGFPTGDDVQSSLGIDDDQVKAYPTQVLNLDPYANYTEEGWSVRFHGNLYKQPNVEREKLNDLANVFLVGVDIEDLPENQAEQARNLTASIFVLQQGDVAVAPIQLEPAPSAGASGENGGGDAVTPDGGSQTVTLPYNTTDQGDFDAFVPINSTGLTPGNETSQIQRLSTHVEGATLGNSTAFLVPNEGLTIVSDIDDILRVTKIYEPKEGLLNSFARPFEAWRNMPSIYANWSSSLQDAHFHYLTTTPEQVTRAYMSFIGANYPGGSFDTRPLNFSDISATLHIRRFLLDKIFQTFPQRKFVLVADTSNSDVMKAYPQMAKEYPGQVNCIFLRNTSATDSGDKFPYDTSGFEGLPQSQYMFFRVPDDLSGLDIENGQCYNQTIPQNLTFGYQGLPFGLGDDAAVNGSADGTESGAAGGVHIAASLTFLGMLAMVFVGFL